MSTLSHYRTGARPTLRDVAELVGVSPNTVSVILNDRPRAQDYAEETRQRVHAAAAQLGYLPNPLAQVLKKKHSNLVGAAVFTRESNFYNDTLQAADLRIRDCGFETITSDMAKRQERLSQCIHMLTAWRVEGVLAILGGHAFDRKLLDMLRHAGTPVVVVGPYRPEYAISCVDIDNFAAGRVLARHLVELGHRQIGVLAGNFEHNCSLQRIRGARSVLRDNGIDLPETHIVRTKDCRFEAAAGYHGAAKLLQQAPRVTAIMCINDEMAIGCMSRLRESGVRIPEDVSVTGFDDAFLGDCSSPENRLGLHTCPPLTTMRLPLDELGRTAADLLLDIIKGKLHAEAPRFAELNAELIVRSSTSHSKASSN